MSEHDSGSSTPDEPAAAQPDQRSAPDSAAAGTPDGTAGSAADFDPYRYGRPDPNPSHDAFGRPLPGHKPQAAQQYPPPQQYPPGGYAPPPAGYGPPPGYTVPPGYPAPPGYPQYQQPGSNGMATAGLVLGIVSLVLCWASILDIPLVILGITFAAIGLSRAKRGAGGRGMALTGLICSLVAAVAVTVIIAVIVPKYIDCYHKHGQNTAQIRHCISGSD